MNMRRIISCLLLPAYLSSCMSWQVPPVSPEQVITEDQPSKIRVTLTDSSTVEMEQPRIVGDTLHGFVPGTPPAEVKVLLAEVSRVEVKKGDLLKTAGLSLGIIAVVIAAAIVLCPLHD